MNITIETTTTLSSYIDALQKKGQYYFTRELAKSSANLSEYGFRSAAYRLKSKSRVNRVRKDFFVIVPLEYSSAGCPPASWFIDEYMQHCNASYYVGLSCAAYIHGSLEAASALFQVVTNKQIRELQVGDLKIQFCYHRSLNTVPIEIVKTETGFMRVSTLEVTVCDLVRYMQHIGSFSRLIKIMSELIAHVELDRLIEYIKKCNIELSVIQRLGYILEMIAPEINTSALYDLVKVGMPRYRTLISNNPPADCRRDNKWKILINI